LPVHRLSNCKLFKKIKPAVDWKEEIDRKIKIKKLKTIEKKLIEKIKSSKSSSKRKW